MKRFLPAFSFLIFFSFLFLLPLSKTHAAGEDCDFTPNHACSSSSQHCEASTTGNGQVVKVKIVTCNYQFMTGPLGLWNEVTDLGQQHCFNQATGKTYQIGDTCTDGTTQGTCGYPMENAGWFSMRVGAPPKTIEPVPERAVMTCIDNSKIVIPPVKPTCLNAPAPCSFLNKAQCCSGICAHDPTDPILTDERCYDSSPPPLVNPINPVSTAKTIICQVSPSSGYSVDTPFKIILTNYGTVMPDYVFYEDTDPNSPVIKLDELFATTQDVANGQIVDQIGGLPAGTYKISVKGYDGPNLKQQCTTTNAVTVKAPVANIPKLPCQITASPPANGTEYAKGETVNLTTNLNGLQVDTGGYEVSASPSWTESQELTTNGGGQLIFSVNVNGGKATTTIRIEKNGQQVCDDLNLNNSDTSSGSNGSNIDPSQWDANQYANPTPPCVQNGSGTNTYFTCPTGLGIDIDTTPSGFVQGLFEFILSISGGIALLLIIVSGYRIMASQGNPEKLQKAREQLTSALVGLLFIIFSVVILQIIGVDVLHIPGFG